MITRLRDRHDPGRSVGVNRAGLDRLIESRATTLRGVFGGAMVLVGVMHLIFGEEAKRLFPVWPDGLPGRPLWAHVAGGLLTVLGIMRHAEKARP